LLGADRAFLAGFLNAGDELGTVKSFILAVALLNPEVFAVNLLICRVPRVALQAFTASTDLHTISTAP
jgi:hypothetical protein